MWYVSGLNELSLKLSASRAWVDLDDELYSRSESCGDDAVFLFLARLFDPNFWEYIHPQPRLLFDKFVDAARPITAILSMIGRDCGSPQITARVNDFLRISKLDPSASQKAATDYIALAKIDQNDIPLGVRAGYLVHGLAIARTCAKKNSAFDLQTDVVKWLVANIDSMPVFGLLVIEKILDSKGIDQGMIKSALEACSVHFDTADKDWKPRSIVARIKLASKMGMRDLAENLGVAGSTMLMDQAVAAGRNFAEASRCLKEAASIIPEGKRFSAIRDRCAALIRINNATIASYMTPVSVPKVESFVPADLLATIRQSSFDQALATLCSFTTLEANSISQRSDSDLDVLFSVVEQDADHANERVTEAGDDAARDAMRKLRGRSLGRYVVSSGALQPAWDVFSGRVAPTEQELEHVTSSRKFVSPRQVPFYKRAFTNALEGRFHEALSIIIPQIEESIRNVFRANQIMPANLGLDAIEDRWLLGRLLENDDAMSKSFPPFVVETLRDVLSRQGKNFRNKICHGLMAPSEFKDPDLYYLFWLTIALTSGNLKLP
ncbi:hypothetical protein D3C71_418490 [compost metagenome]